MKFQLYNNIVKSMNIQKIAVIGPGIVGMPMAALLAAARMPAGDGGAAEVVVIQRNSITSGWKVDAINSGKSTIGGVEPELDVIIPNLVKDGLLRASHDYANVSDADVIIICVQTDKAGLAPDYKPLYESLNEIIKNLKAAKISKTPLVIIESTLAPSSMNTIIKEIFAKEGFIDGLNIWLGNSPNRVMPGRLTERIRKSDKLAGGLNPITPLLIEYLYKKIIIEGKIYKTNSMTAETIKTLENAYRDVRIAYSTEICRYCDRRNIDYFRLRDLVNKQINQEDAASFNNRIIPTGGMLIPTAGVGGHCLPKDGILLLWRKTEKMGMDRESVIMKSREINDSSPDYVVSNVLNSSDSREKSIVILGAAYRGDSEDTRNSPSLVVAQKLISLYKKVILHDPYVKKEDQNLIKTGLEKIFTNDLDAAVEQCEEAIICTPHYYYYEHKDKLAAGGIKRIFDACNLFSRNDFNIMYSGIGKGTEEPSEILVKKVSAGFRRIEKLFANEVVGMVNYLNSNFAGNEYNKIEYAEVQRIARTCLTGCNLTEPGDVDNDEDIGRELSQLASTEAENIIQI